MLQGVLELSDFPLCDLPEPIGLKREYCFDRRLTLDAIGGFLPFTGSNHTFWDEKGSLLLRCINQTPLLEDYKIVKNPRGDVIYTLWSPPGVPDVDICDSETEVCNCGDTPGPKREMCFDFDVFGAPPPCISGTSKDVVQWQLVLINDRDDGVLFADWKAVARFTQRGWWRSNRRVEIAKNVDYSLVAMALVVLDLVGTSGYLINPTKSQVLTPMGELWDQLEPGGPFVLWEEKKPQREEEVVRAKFEENNGFGMTANGGLVEANRVGPKENGFGPKENGVEPKENGIGPKENGAVLKEPESVRSMILTA
ncbi:hypothetical protein IAU59_002354 [Kwoniella sp. CBS 9459]